MLATEVWGLKFTNPLGLAAGFDKHGEVSAEQALEPDVLKTLRFKVFNAHIYGA